MTGAEYVAKDLGMSVATTGVESLGTVRKVRASGEAAARFARFCRSLSLPGVACVQYAGWH